MLEVKHISKEFRGKPVLNDISFSLERGKSFCIAGPSGAGKTTLLNICAGMLSPDSGVVTSDGEDISHIPDYRNKVVGYLPCGNCLFDSLTVLENIRYSAHCTKDKIEELLDLLAITKIVDSYPREISSGEYKRVCFARTLAMDTPYLLLDEPTSNLDELSAELIVTLLDSLQKEKGILISTHDKRLMKGPKICV